MVSGSMELTQRPGSLHSKHRPVLVHSRHFKRTKSLIAPFSFSSEKENNPKAPQSFPKRQGHRLRKCERYPTVR